MLMKTKDNRFADTYRQGKADVMESCVDRGTGVSYLHHALGSAGGAAGVSHHRRRL